MDAATRPPGSRIEVMDQARFAAEVATARMLAEIADFDRQRLWRVDGATSMSAWLCMRYGVRRGTATEWVRVAHALEGLPAIREAHAEGRLSYDQLRPLTHFATPQTDRALAEEAPSRSAASLWREKDRLAKLDAAAEEKDRTKRYLEVWRDEDRWVWIEGHLPPEEGAAVRKALAKRAEEVAPDPEAADPGGARMADALFELATETGKGPGGETLVVHADAEVLAGTENGDAPNGRPHLAETEDGVRLPDESIRRMACDAKIEWVLEREGRTVGIGRRRRGVPQWLRSHLAFRDRGCRFPGCGRDRWVKAHHLVHWARGGPTDAGNLVLLCHAHHRLIHEGGWQLAGDPEGELTWVRPNGSPLETGAGLSRAGPSP